MNKDNKKKVEMNGKSEQDKYQSNGKMGKGKKKSRSKSRSSRSRSRSSSSRHSQDKDDRKRTRSKSTSRSSDVNYEMDYGKMSKVMKEAIAAERPKNIEWKPLLKWIRFDETIDNHAQYAFAPMEKRIAGSCHELIVVYLKRSHGGEIVTRLMKLARDPNEDNQYHFDTERQVSQYLCNIANCVNRIFHSRHDVCIWPVETVLFEYQGKQKWATVQAPFLPLNHSVFVKIEPNSGRPCVHDPVVGRYQHCFAAITRGLNLVRDWQGYGVNYSTFLQQCQVHSVPKALQQIRTRNHNNDNTMVLVVIDPVLTTCNAHYETDNPTDFGVKAVDEWLETHDCARCRCSYFNLLPEIQFGLADPSQEFFDDKLPLLAKKHIENCQRKLNIWCGDANFFIPDVVSGNKSDKKADK